MKHPNVIVCMCDQLRAFEVGCYGNAVIRTPNIDKLAAEGARFETAITNFPVCMAARSVLLSGQYNRTCTGGIGNVTDHGYMPQYPAYGRPHLKQPTMPEAFRALGYHTAAIGKWHVHSWPRDIGFDHYVIPRVHHCHAGQHFTEDDGPEFVPDGFSVDYECERVERYLRERRASGKPFFLYYNISPPHCPVADAPEEYLKMYRPDEVPIRGNVDSSKPIDERHLKIYRWDYKFYRLGLPHTMTLPPGYGIRELTAEYYGMTTWTDDAVGRMLRALSAHGLAENTIVVFLSDHGDNLGSHGRVQKGNPHEESVRIPFIWRWPGAIKPGVIREQVGSIVDIFSTMMGLAGAKAPEHIHGTDLAPVLRGEAPSTARPWAFAETFEGPAIRTNSHMLFMAAKARALDARPGEFYDLRSDALQMKNLVTSGEQEETAVELAERLRAWDRATPWMN